MVQARARSKMGRARFLWVAIAVGCSRRPPELIETCPVIPQRRLSR